MYQPPSEKEGKSLEGRPWALPLKALLLGNFTQLTNNKAPFLTSICSYSHYTTSTTRLVSRFFNVHVLKFAVEIRFGSHLWSYVVVVTWCVAVCTEMNSPYRFSSSAFAVILHILFSCSFLLYGARVDHLKNWQFEIIRPAKFLRLHKRFSLVIRNGQNMPWILLFNFWNL